MREKKEMDTLIACLFIAGLCSLTCSADCKHAGSDIRTMDLYHGWKHAPLARCIVKLTN